MYLDATNAGSKSAPMASRVPADVLSEVRGSTFASSFVIVSKPAPMRQIALLLSSLIGTAVAAQNYLANDPVWRVNSTCGVPAPCIAYDYYNYSTASDSVIQGVTWTKVLRQGLYSLVWQSPNPPDPNCQGVHPYGPTADGSYTKLIRQQGRQLRIWADDTDQLLFDFDLVAGSTLPLSWNNWNTDITVLAVDSVLIGTEMRARYELGNSWAQYLIEGVGSSHGLFEPLSNFFDCGYGLDCFGLGSIGYYPAEGPNCALEMGIAPSAALPANLLVPNPANDVVRISAAAPWITLEIRDARGAVVLRQHKSVNNEIAVSMLKPGLYTVHGLGALPLKLIIAR